MSENVISDAFVERQRLSRTREIFEAWDEIKANYNRVRDELAAGARSNVQSCDHSVVLIEEDDDMVRLCLNCGGYTKNAGGIEGQTQIKAAGIGNWAIYNVDVDRIVE